MPSVAPKLKQLQRGEASTKGGRITKYAWLILSGCGQFFESFSRAKGGIGRRYVCERLRNPQSQNPPHICPPDDLQLLANCLTRQDRRYL